MLTFLIFVFIFLYGNSFLSYFVEFSEWLLSSWISLGPPTVNVLRDFLSIGTGLHQIQVVYNQTVVEMHVS